MSALEIQALQGQSLIKVAQDVNLSRWVSAAAITILIYDTLLTLGDEVRLIWPKKLSVIKVLTNLNRIIALSFILLNAHQLCALQRGFSNHFCEVLLVATGIGALVSFAMSNWILLARTKALLGDSRILNYALVAYYLIAYSVTATLVLHTSISLLGNIFYSKTLRVCGVAIRPKTMSYIWLPPMVFETTVFLFTIYKLYQKAMETQHLGSNLLIVLYRDGVCYYFIIIGLRVFNFLVWLIFPTSLTLIGIFLLWSIMTIAVTRLQINLLRAVEPGATAPMSFMSGKRRGGMHSFSIHGNRNRAHTIEITTTTTEHRDYPPRKESLPLRSFGEVRAPTPYTSRHTHEPEAHEPSSRHNLAPFNPGNGTAWQPQRQPPRGPQFEQARALEMRAMLNSRGRVILREVDSLETIPPWEKGTRSRDRLV